MKEFVFNGAVAITGGLVVAMAIGLLLAGFGFGQEGLAKDCARFGAFYVDKVRYECSRTPNGVDGQ